jgi:predicted metal-dependent hydrolase
MAGAVRVGEPPIEVHLRHDARARRMVLRIGRSGRSPTLTLPPGVPAAHVEAFLRDQEGWLRRQLDGLARRVPVRDGTVLPFGDGALTIAAIVHGRLHTEGGVLHVPGPAAQVPVRARAYLREAAREACAEGAARLAAGIGRAPARISLRDPRARWGSCTSRGDLMFSWRLALAPSAVLDYVVAHEVAHLAELNHSPAFWDVVRRLCPDHTRHRDWLRRHGPDLHAFDFAPAADA